MLATETTHASAVPQTTAIGRTAKTYRTPRLSTGTYGFRSSIAPVTTATAAALASRPRASLFISLTVLPRTACDLVAQGDQVAALECSAVNRDDDRGDQDRDDVRDLDYGGDRRGGGGLVRIADRGARDRGGVSFGALAAVGAVLDELLRVVPGAAARGHRDREEETRDDRADQQAAEHADVDQTDDDRERDRDDRGDDHRLDRRAGD